MMSKIKARERLELLSKFTATNFSSLPPSLPALLYLNFPKAVRFEKKKPISRLDLLR